MFTSVSRCIQQFFNMITLLFAAGENISRTAVVLSTVAVDTSEMYADEARITRAKRLAQLNSELTIAEGQATQAIAKAQATTA